MNTPTPRTNRAWNILGDDNAEAAWSFARTLERELAAERVQAKLWEDKCHELIAPHYILDPCLRAHRFREALQFHPVLNNNPTPFWKKYGGPNDT